MWTSNYATMLEATMRTNYHGFDQIVAKILCNDLFSSWCHEIVRFQNVSFTPRRASRPNPPTVRRYLLNLVRPPRCTLHKSGLVL